MENQFFVDSEYLSPKALEKKHRLETDPSSRKNHMEYLQFQKKYLILFPVSFVVSRNTGASGIFPICRFFSRRDHLTPGLSNSRFCTFEGAPVFLFPCYRDSDLPRGAKI